MSSSPTPSQNLGGNPGGAFLVVQVDEAFVSGTTPGDLAGIGQHRQPRHRPTVHFTTGAILTAALTINAQLAVIALPAGLYEKYLGLRYTVVGTYTLGKISAFLTRDVQTWRPYATAQASNL